ncbi:hypothetical protein MUN77_01350 [Leucobacter allii]|uniref:hypothetical protein n=1 Tax=Leucobacter allii TaxID=2932247 RepID=UPI001FD119A7|nr:hypothetical protein [Leucobacter allii]UOR02006.1 hypothetical protein MUN77_01350 [Leucobacter allii]
MFLPEYDPSYDPVEHLDRMGVRLIKRTMFHTNAIWIPEQRTVAMNRGLRADLVHATLSHECSHAENDDCGGHHPRNEGRADLHSALRNINPLEWERLVGINDDYDALCLELRITRRQFRAYHRHRLQKVAARMRVEQYGNAIYLDPKMGVGQYAAKYEVA